MGTPSILTASPYTGVEIRGRSIRIKFKYEGKWVRETLNWLPTENGLEAAFTKLETVKREIKFRTFKYEEHFPDSKRAKKILAITDMTVASAVEGMLAIHTLKKSTLRGYRIAFEHHIKPTLGNTLVRDLTKNDVTGLRTELLKKYKPKTVNNALSVLRRALHYAVNEKAMKKNIAKKVHGVKLPKPNVDPLDRQELSKLLLACEPAFQNMILFWVSAGLRLSEIRALRWSDIDFKKQKVHVQRAFVLKELKAPKTDVDRVVDFGAVGMKALIAQKAISGDMSHGYIFTKPHNGEPWHLEHDMWSAMNVRCRRAGIRRRSPTQLRHTYASMALSAGESPYYVMTQMGHKDLKVLNKHYAKWLVDETAGLRHEQYLTKGLEAIDLPVQS